MREQIVILGDPRSCQGAIEAADIMMPVTIEASFDPPGTLDAYTADGERLGRLGPRSWVTQALADGQQVLHASVNSVGHKDGLATVRVRIVVGREGERYEAPPVVKRTYSVGLVGESNYQEAIRTCRVGEPVVVSLQPDNPYDDRALVVTTLDDQTVGYIPRDNWLQDAVHEEGKGCDATIRSIDKSPGGALGVVLEVRLDDGELQTRTYGKPEPAGSTGCFGSIAALCLLTVIAGCGTKQDPLKEAEARVSFLKLNDGSPEELCEAKRAVQHVQLERRDAEGYKLAKVLADLECHRARIEM